DLRPEAVPHRGARAHDGRRGCRRSGRHRRTERPDHPAAGRRPRRADRGGRRRPAKVSSVGWRPENRGPAGREVRCRGPDAGAQARRWAMRVLDVVQGSPDWLQARLGIPTASQADRIMTPRQLNPASAQREYLHQLLAEWVLGNPIDWGQASPWAERGTEMEAEARTAYELEMGVDVQTTGLLLTDDGLFGGSPDGLVGDDGGVEIKCPGIHTHIGYLLDPSTLAERYRGQTQ